MEHELVQPMSTDPADVVAFTQHMRYRMFDELTVKGTDLKTNIKETMQLLRDMDNSALTTRKLNIDEKEVDNGRQTLTAFERLRNMLGNRDPFAAGSDSPLPVAQRVRPAIAGNYSLPSVTMLVGEDAQGEQPLSISNYIPAEE